MFIKRPLADISSWAIDYTPPSLCFSDNGAVSAGGGTSSFTPEEQAAFEQMQADDGAEPVEGQDALEQSPEAAQEQGEAGEQKEAAPPQMVPRAALHEERERRKKVEQEAAENRREWERRFNMLVERFPQPQPQQPAQQQQQVPPLPDPEKDLPGFLIERQNRMEAGLRELVQHVIAQRQQSAQESQQNQALAHITNAAQMAEAQFTREHPDYTDAANFLAETRHKELELAGHRDPARRMAVIREEALGLAHAALQEGRNPAETVYEMAKLRGWKPPQANSSQTAAQRVQQIAAGQEQSRTTGNMRGAAPNGIGIQNALSMSRKEFDTFMEKATPEQLQAVFGA